MYDLSSDQSHRRRGGGRITPGSLPKPGTGVAAVVSSLAETVVISCAPTEIPGQQ